MSQSRRQREVGFREDGRWRQFYGPTAVTDVTRRSSAREFVTRGRFAGHDVMDGFMGNGGMLRPRDQKSSPWKPRKRCTFESKEEMFKCVEYLESTCLFHD